MPKPQKIAPPPPRRGRNASQGDGLAEETDTKAAVGGPANEEGEEGAADAVLPLRTLLERLANTRAELRRKAAVAAERCADLSDGRDHAGLHVGVTALALSPASKSIAHNAWSLQQSMRALHGQRDPADGKVVLVLPEDPWKEKGGHAMGRNGKRDTGKAGKGKRDKGIVAASDK